MNANIKIFELRDEGTLIPWLAMRWAYPAEMVLEGLVANASAELALLRRAGYGDSPEESDCVIQGPAHCSGKFGEALSYNPAHVTDPRLRWAAIYISEHFAELVSGQVLDVRVIMGETTVPAPAEFGVNRDDPAPGRYDANGPWTFHENGYFRGPGEEPWGLSISQGTRIVATVTGATENECRLRARTICDAVNARGVNR